VPKSANSWRNRDGGQRIWLWFMMLRISWIAQRKSASRVKVLFVAIQLHDRFEHCPVDRPDSSQLNTMDAASATTEDPVPCGAQLFPFMVARVRSPAKAGANTPSSALAEETTYTGYENLGAPATRCSRPASM
jgi:hypothetical protein